ncbi:MAG TPA: UvrD-helicase domain-containing protein [Opitutaceae bacterium]|nr:UvrD-helicase domain-containing protein [Opitutaceae bacterium]
MSARHVMILASAGSGKTYALTNRFVALLARGARPERIVALTFTRKAAGEFFDEILRKLARAAREPEFAAQLAADIEQPRLGPADFLRMLRGVVEAMHRLPLGTLDGFFARIARAFPLELGLTGEFEILQEHASRLERRRVLQRMFARAPDGLDTAQREFIEAFKRATFGAEEKRLAARLDAFLDEHQEKFLAAPAAELWGEASRIWPRGNAWLAPRRRKLADAVADLQAALARRALPPKQQARWDLFFAALPEWSPGAPLPRALEYILENALAVWSDVGRGCAEMTVERKRIALTPDECADLATIVREIVAAEFTRRLETTRGIHAVLRGYETVYHDAVRRGGKLTFGDVQRLLQPDVSGESLTRAAADEGEGRLFIDFRLDAQFDHWLLDEFQDTSFGQWSVLRNLIDEAVQNPAGERSFFCVGDVKQAIFTWREGDPRLFREIFEHYNRMAPGAIAEKHLVQSWRSGPAIIEMVNAIFGRGDALAQLFPGAASEAWNREWRAHESARAQLASHAAWLHAADEPERFALTVRLLHEIAPLERGLECAVLTQTNATATALADYLRREGGIPAIAESDLRVGTDNPLGAALLALAQAAAHPGDTLAQEHWQMTQLRAVLAAEGVATPEALTQRLLAQVHADGFERAMEFWLRRIEPTLAPADAFSRERARQFVAAAALFDATGSRDVAEFVAFMERHTVRDAETAGVVRVMTIHKSKGLGFDVVVLPDLEGQRLDQRRGGLAIQRTPERAVEWVLDLPPKLFHAQDETLSEHVRAAEAEACYEALSLLYVGLTRAKRAMYAISKPAGTSESRNYPKLLTATLGAHEQEIRIGQLACAGGWSAGDPAWMTRVKPPAPAAKSPEETAPIASAEQWRVPRRAARRPSSGKAGVIDAAQAFALEGGSAADFGTEVHALFAAVEWGGAETVGRFAREWSARGDAAAQALACLRAAELAEVWAGGAGREVWRERGFEIVLDGAWVTGVFDRVVIERDAAGRARRAAVFDFKTDRVATEEEIAAAVERHAAQLNSYRRVAAVLAGVAVAAVTCELIFTRGPHRRTVPPG